jgi:predicted transcriptional regulator
MNINHNKEIELPKLRADIVESILTSCSKGESIECLSYKEKGLVSFNKNIIKKYLFFLIEFGLISYNGQKQIIIIEKKGHDLLNIIEEEKKIGKTDIHNILITF